MCEKLLKIYAGKNSVIYDPFMGSGTTAVACKNMGFDCYGSELSESQVKWAYKRLDMEESNQEIDDNTNENEQMKLF